MSQKQTASLQKAFDDILAEIIDEWYRNVSAFYVTQEQLLKQPEPGREEELKRFHDERGHRIKFNKGDLDFTYGLRSAWQGEDLIIEISVNNKVDIFDYDDFRGRLLAHYRKMGDQQVPGPESLTSRSYREVFQLPSSFRDTFTVERRPEKADIMRLAFLVRNKFVGHLVAEPAASKHLIENYCVSPFRSVYATVYRSTSR